MKKSLFAGLFFIILSSAAQAQAPNTFPATGNVGIGTTTPRGPLDVANATGDIWLTNDGLNSGGQSIMMPGHAYFAPFNGTDNVFIQARRRNDAGSTNFFFRTWNNGSLVEAMIINRSGNVGIGTSPGTNAKLAVEGMIAARSIKVLTGAWPDFVFANNYHLRPLSEVESYIKAHSHLPEVPSAAQVAKDGINLGEMDATLLKKIEELTLYLIEQNKKIEALEKQLSEAKK